MITETEYMLPMEIIATAGEAKSLAMEAIMNARKGNIEKAKELVAEANKMMVIAHETQMKLLVKEAEGEETKVHLILLHSMDHISMAISTRDFALEAIEIYSRLKVLEEK